MKDCQKKWNKKNVVNISFLKKNWKFGHLLLTSFEDKLKIEPPPPLYTLYEGSKHVNINWRLKIEIVQCTHYMKAANCKHCPLIWNWISKVIAAEGEHKASRSVMNVVNVKFDEKRNNIWGFWNCASKITINEIGQRPKEYISFHYLRKVIDDYLIRSLRLAAEVIADCPSALQVCNHR